MELATRSLRTVRLTAAAPRIAAYAVVAILAAAGLRVVIAGPPTPPAAPKVHVPAPPDYSAQAFAQGFAREYLTWTADDDGDDRTQRLQPYLGTGLDGDGGLTPADGTAQAVTWTAVGGVQATGAHAATILVDAGTTHGEVHLSVPVSRDGRGFLGVAGYPALVGPAPVDTPGATRAAAGQQDVDDAGLQRVAARAVTNYLAGEQENLLADLTPDAVVSLPEQRLRVTAVQRTSWVSPQRTVAVEVQAQDARGDTWTLRYVLEVQHRDRWYVRSLQLDPTTGGE